MTIPSNNSPSRLSGDPMAATEPAVSPLCLDEHDMAKALGISKPMLMKMRAAGQVPFVRAGRRVLYAVHHIERWLDDNVGRDVTQHSAEDTPSPA